MKIFTIGFTKKSLEDFVTLLKENRITKIVDIRLKNDSQLAGWAKGRDLKYVLENHLKIKYKHLTDLAPSEALLKSYKKDNNWKHYEIEFDKILKDRDLEIYYPMLLDEDENICLLCSESTAEKCHRRLVAEHLQKTHPDLEIIHI